MDIKKAIKETFSDIKNLKEYRYNSAKIFFIISSLLFFLNYFFVGARFKDEFFLKTLPFIYVIFLLSFCFYIYVLGMKKFENKMIYIGLGILLVAIFGVFILPIVGI